MPSIFSNQLKALLITENIAEQGVSVWQGNCHTVQHFSYECRRRQNDSGTPYGPTIPAYLDFTIRQADGESGKVFFDRMLSHESFPYSFLFNASFNDMRRLSDCEDAMVVTGYVINLEETYDKTQESGSEEQLLLKGRILICNIAYLGREKVLKLTITND